MALGRWVAGTEEDDRGHFQVTPYFCLSFIPVLFSFLINVFFYFFSGIDLNGQANELQNLWNKFLWIPG